MNPFEQRIEGRFLPRGQFGRLGRAIAQEFVSPEAESRRARIMAELKAVERFVALLKDSQ